MKAPRAAGWMDAITMDYKVDDAAIVTRVKAGD
jgi:Cu/Ag efflux protein CusF